MASTVGCRRHNPPDEKTVGTSVSYPESDLQGVVGWGDHWKALMASWARRRLWSPPIRTVSQCDRDCGMHSSPPSRPLMTHRRLALAAVLLSGLLGCGSDDASWGDWLFAEPVDDERRAVLRSELEEAQSRWRQADVAGYWMEVRIVTGVGPVSTYRLQMEGDSITFAMLVRESWTAPVTERDSMMVIPRDSLFFNVPEDSSRLGLSGDSLHSMYTSRLPTVSRLYSTLDMAVDSAPGLTVEYDQELGYPRSVGIDPSMAFDDHVYYDVTEFELRQGR